MKKVAVYISFLLFVIICDHPSHAQVWKKYADSAWALSGQLKINDAIQMYTLAREELIKDSLGTMSYAEVCKNLALLYELGAGQYKKAEPLYREAMQTIEKVEGKESLKYAESCGALGDLYRSTGQYQQSEPLLLEAQKIRERIVGKDHQDYAASCNDLGLLYMAIEKYKDAEVLFLQARQTWSKTPGREHTDYAKSCNNLAYLYSRLNELDKAETFLIEAREIFLKVSGNTDPNYAGTCNNLAGLYLMRNKYERAEPLLKESMAIVEKTYGNEHPDYAKSCINLGQVYISMNLYQKAEPLFIKARDISGKSYGSQHNDYVQSCQMLARLYMVMGLYEKAEPLFLESQQILLKLRGNEHPAYANSCSNLANLYRLMGQLQKAEAFALEAKQITEKIPGKQHLSYGKRCEELAVVYERKGQLEKAEALFLEARETALKISGKENADYTYSCNGLATLYRRMKKYEESEALFLEARQTWEKVQGKNDPMYAAITHNLGRLYQKIGQYQKAELMLLEAKELRERLLGKSHMDYMASCSRLGNLYWNIKENEKAKSLYSEAYDLQSALINRAFEFTGEAEKEQFINEIANLDPFYLSFLTSVFPNSHQGLVYDACLSSRNIILNSSRQFRETMYSSTDSAIRSKYDELLYLKQRLSFWYAKPVARRPAYVNDFEVQANNLEKELTIISSAFKEHRIKNVTWTDIQQALHPNEAAIEFVKFKFFNGNEMTDTILYFAVLLRKDRPAPELIPLFESRKLSALLGTGNTLTTITSLYQDNRSLTAYKLIWSPLERHLENITRIYFAPAGLLYRICFAAIPVNSSQVLSDKYELVQLNTTASIVNREEQLIASADNILLFGGIQYDADSVLLKQSVAALHKAPQSDLFGYSNDTRGSTWKYLAGTEKEIRNIETMGRQRNYSITLSHGANATEEKFKELNGTKVSVLHVATHGFFFPDKKDSIENTESSETEKALRQSDNPLLRAGLLFAGANYAWKGKPITGVENGILTAYEISNLSLPQTKLVVLSACETGLGDIQGNEGVYGLQRAFKIAGVESLVMSLWKVPDNTTAEFMQAFYKNIFNKQSISDAFYHAQTLMKNKYRKQPYNWAAWVLVK